MTNQEYWKSLSKSYLVDDILLSIVKEQSKLVTFSNSNTEGNEEPILYDIYGLSYYARLAIFTLNFIKEIGIQVFFKKNADGVRSRLWVINELILVQNILNNSNLLRKTTKSIISSESLQSDSFQYDISRIIDSLTSKDKSQNTEGEEEDEETLDRTTVEEVDVDGGEEEEEEEEYDEEMADIYWDNIIELINFDEDVEITNHDIIITLIANAFKIIKETGYPYASIFNTLLGYALKKYEISEERAEILLSEIVEPTIFINGNYIYIY